MAPECIYIPKKSQHTLQHAKPRNERQSRNGRINLNLLDCFNIGGNNHNQLHRKTNRKIRLKKQYFKIIGAYTSKTPSKKHSPLQRVNKVHN